MPCFILQISSEEIFKTIKLGTFSMLIMALPPISISNLLYGPNLSCILLDQVRVTKERVSVL